MITTRAHRIVNGYLRVMITHHASVADARTYARRRYTEDVAMTHWEIKVEDTEGIVYHYSQPEDEKDERRQLLCSTSS